MCNDQIKLMQEPSEFIYRNQRVINLQNDSISKDYSKPTDTIIVHIIVCNTKFTKLIKLSDTELGTIVPTLISIIYIKIN